MLLPARLLPLLTPLLLLLLSAPLWPPLAHRPLGRRCWCWQGLAAAGPSLLTGTQAAQRGVCPHSCRGREVGGRCGGSGAGRCAAEEGRQACGQAAAGGARLIRDCEGARRGEWQGQGAAINICPPLCRRPQHGRKRHSLVSAVEQLQPELALGRQRLPRLQLVQAVPARSEPVR